MPGALGRHLLSSVAAGEGPRRVRPVGACSPQAGAPGREPGGRALPTCRADQGHEVKAFAARPSLGSGSRRLLRPDRSAFGPRRGEGRGTPSRRASQGPGVLPRELLAPWAQPCCRDSSRPSCRTRGPREFLMTRPIAPEICLNCPEEMLQNESK
ncbi:uncharacterized protein LOC144305275 [Canis aureus]